jgi:predicted AlkP superfamily pyrophosphatase or phosphodiesterase
MTLVRSLVAMAGVICLAPSAQMARAQAPDQPRLLVIVVVDQMRFDYLDRMQPYWTRGMKRLMTEGAVFERNFYPYLQTVTCAGHATIGTGAFPATHGIILNAWWRGTRSASCTEDPAVSSIGYGSTAEPVGHSAAQLLVPTIGDRLRERSPASRIVTVSLKPRSAVMLAGRSGLVTWLDDSNHWATSTAFASAPDAAMQAFVTAHPRERLRQEIWSQVADPKAYTGPDAGPGEAPPAGWTSTFPHPLAGAPGSPPDRFFALWETSPYADSYLGEMASAMVRDLRLGQGEAVDYLGVSFSALDYVGHAFGPDSHEVQDTLMRLDSTVGDLLDTLDAQVGRGRYVLGFSADHGVAPVPEARQAAGAAGGRISTQRLTEVANAAIAREIGPGRHVVRVEYTQLYLSEEAQQKVRQHPQVLQSALAALQEVPGVERVLLGEGLERKHASTDPVVRAAALSHVPGRSGQLVVIPKLYYLMGAATATGTTHGTNHPYDQHVPLIFFGSHIKQGRYPEAATPADLAPTLAATIGLPMPGIDGTVQRSALRR